MNKTIKLIPTILWGFFILFLTLKPKSHNGSNLPLWLENLHPDKIAHFAFWAIWYAIFAFTVLKKQASFFNTNAEQNKSVNNSFKAFYFIMVATVIGAIIEILQWKLNWGRSAEWMDLLCDILGLLFSYLFFRKSTSLK